MKADIKTIEGKGTKKVDLPQCFSVKIREDLVAKVLEAKKHTQPYAPALDAGKQHAASGKFVHRRHVWRSGYGRGMSRVPRKIMSRRGSQFSFIGAEVSSTVGGRRAHPPKTIAMKNTLKINKKEMALALQSALAATATPAFIQKRYETLTQQDAKEMPIVLESKITQLKVKELLKGLQHILGKTLYALSLKKRSIRKGKGKQRGRKYKKSLGALLVLGSKEHVKTKIIDTVHVHTLGVTDLAKGGLGRITLYTEQALKELEEKFS